MLGAPAVIGSIEVGAEALIDRLGLCYRDRCFQRPERLVAATRIDHEGRRHLEARQCQLDTSAFGFQMPVLLTQGRGDRRIYRIKIDVETSPRDDILLGRCTTTTAAL
ncbi:hypothetical protein D3C77_709850 [compost metagenome]